MNDGRRELEIYIRTSPDELWDAITNPDKTRLYWFTRWNHSTWTPGAPWTSDSGDGEVYLDGEIIDVDRPHRLLHHDARCRRPAQASEPPSTVEWTSPRWATPCRLVVVNTDLGPETL